MDAGITLSVLGEDSIVDALTRGLPMNREILVGPGDDCAVLRGCSDRKHILFKTDCMVEGIHFLRSDPPEKVGWKTLCRALSDIAAMAGKPKSALITIAAPSDLPWKYLQKIYAGFRRACRKYDLSLSGGETSRSPGPLFLNVSLLGECEAPPILRSGARHGDWLAVTGRLGGSFKSGRHLKFHPRIEESLWLRKQLPPTSLMDLSDGLATDLPRLAKSSGLGFELHLESIPLSPKATITEALSDGEDYEILFTLPPQEWGRVETAWKRRFPRLKLSRIGVMSRDGSKQLDISGFSHFSG